MVDERSGGCLQERGDHVSGHAYLMGTNMRTHVLASQLELNRSSRSTERKTQRKCVTSDFFDF